VSEPTPTTAPVCPACHGYGSADGLPCGTHERDFGSEAPAACRSCGGTGEEPPPATVRMKDVVITISTPEPKSYVFRTVGGAE
jgi:hypothetical protein